MSGAVQAWIKRNEESLRAEYRAYGDRHDYDPEGVMTFQAWAEREYRIEQDHLRWERQRGLAS